MKKAYLFAAGLAALTTAQADAATLISAAVTGGTATAPTGTVWDTTQNSFYTLFLARPLGTFINGTNPTIAIEVPAGQPQYFLFGEGFTPGTDVNSDNIYTLTLTFDDGAVLTGEYTVADNGFASSGPVTVGGTTYSLTDFSFTRTRANYVSAFDPTIGGDSNDYAGNFRLTAVAAAVPEPASWAMMIGGFGFAGASLRTRRTRAKVAFAA